MLRRLCQTASAALLPMLLCAVGHALPPAPYPTATLAVNGGETSINGGWDNGPITIDFNGFVETVNYGQFSTPASLAAGLAAMFSRDYIALGLYAKAGANSNQDLTVITFQLATGASFGPVQIAGSAASFTFTPSGFASLESKTPDRGTATLSFNGQAIAVSNYGDGSTGATIAEDLALQARSSLVRVTSQGYNLFLEAKQATGSYSYPYDLSFSTTASFSSSPGSGTLSSSVSSGAVPVYSYFQTYNANGSVSGLADSVMGTWAYGYDGLNRVTSGVAMAGGGGSYAGQSACWSYDSFGNRLAQSVSPGGCGSSPPATFAASYTADNRIATVTSSPALAVAYDGAGNTTRDGYTAYTYDAEGRVCALKGRDGMIGYQYDADGNRIGKGTVTDWQSCDLTANGYVATTDYVLGPGTLSWVLEI